MKLKHFEMSLQPGGSWLLFSICNMLRYYTLYKRLTSLSCLTWSKSMCPSLSSLWPQSFIHNLHFSPLDFGFGIKKTPLSYLSRYRLSVLHVPQAHCFTIFCSLVSEKGKVSQPVAHRNHEDFFQGSRVKRVNYVKLICDTFDGFL